MKMKQSVLLRNITGSVLTRLSYRQCVIIFNWAGYASRNRKSPPFDAEETALKVNMYSAMRRLQKKHAKQLCL